MVDRKSTTLFRLSHLLVKATPFVILAVVVAASVLMVVRTRPEWFGYNKPISSAEIDQLVVEVGKIIELPTEEKPTVASISDVEMVKAQPFFKNAQNGDKVLIYANLKKAILYRPSEKKIIEVGNVNLGQQESSSNTNQVTITPSPTLTPTTAVE